MDSASILEHLGNRCDVYRTTYIAGVLFIVSALAAHREQSSEGMVDPHLRNGAQIIRAAQCPAALSQQEPARRVEARMWN